MDQRVRVSKQAESPPQAEAKAPGSAASQGIWQPWSELELFPTLARFGGAEVFTERQKRFLLFPQAQAVSAQLEQGKSFKVAIAQIKTLPTRIDENAERIISAIDKAEEAGANLVVFSELALPGYCSLDNFQNKDYIEANLEALGRIAAHTAGKQVAAIVGFADRGMDKDQQPGAPSFYNSAAVIRDGRIIQIIDKTLLPDYDIFWERRYFEPARRNRLVEIDGVKLGIQICEDLWDDNYPKRISDDLAHQGADLLINLSASPFSPGKQNKRAELIQRTVDKHKIPFLYANLVGAQDAYEGEVVFDGRSLAFGPDGKALAEGRGFEEELLLIDVHSPKRIALPSWPPEEEVFQALVLGIREYFARNGFKRAYIGLSGGIDSALTAALAVEALGAENVIGVTMPSRITAAETKQDAIQLARNLGIRCDVRPIKQQYEAWEAHALERRAGQLDSITKENAQARIRGMILMEYTNEDRQGIVITTGNKTELALGYCTLYGDMCGGLAAISDVSKLMVYDLSRYYNSFRGREIIPESTIRRPPTAELAEGQTDEKGLGAPYSVLSPLVDDIVEHQLSLHDLSDKYGPEPAQRFWRMVQRNEYKRRQAAPGIRVSGKAFGGGRRLPIDNRFMPDSSVSSAPKAAAITPQRPRLPARPALLIDPSRILVVNKLSMLEYDMQRLRLTYEQVLDRYQKGGADLERILAVHERQIEARKQAAAILNSSSLISRGEITPQLANQAQLVIALGGDNHFQYVTHFIGGATPVLGVNSDNLKSSGALLSCGMQQLSDCLQRLREGRYRFEAWSRLRVEIDGQFAGLATCDVIIGEHARREMSRYTFEVHGSLIEQKSSGLLIATGAGSTGWFEKASRYLGPGHKPFPPSLRQAKIVATEVSETLLQGAARKTLSMDGLPAFCQGWLQEGQKLVLQSLNDDLGEISWDSLGQAPFKRGSTAVIELAEEPLWVVRF